MATSVKTIWNCELDVARREFDKAQDAFYRTITACTVSGGANGSGPDCYELALVYNDAIEHYMECLKRQRRTPQVRNELQNAREWKILLAGDLNYLSKFRLARPDHRASNGKEPAGNRGTYLSG